MGQYHGVDAPLDLGDPASELAVLRHSCGIFDLPWRAKILVSGKDRVRWLHNMVTNNVRELGLNCGCYNFVLNSQGRILGDMYIFNQGESLLLDTDGTQSEPLITAMKRFIIMDKVELSSLQINALGICGPKSEEALLAAGIDASGMGALELRKLKLEDHDVTLVRGPENKPGWHELWSNATALESARARLMAAGAVPVGTQALEWWRILQGIPHYGQDIRERDLPQETAQTQALNFTKGCYIGQEIVERIRSRGQVHRSFTGFVFAGAPAAIGKYEANGRTFAEVTSLAVIPLAEGERTLGLGYIREEVRAAGPEVELNNCKARIADLPFTI